MVDFLSKRQATCHARACCRGDARQSWQTRWLNQLCVTARARGDGACAMHAAFGMANAEAELEDARAVAVKALGQALESRAASEDVIRVSSWYSELAMPAAADEARTDAQEEAPSAEAAGFWRELCAASTHMASLVRQATEAERRTARRAKNRLSDSNTPAEFFSLVLERTAA